MNNRVDVVLDVARQVVEAQGKGGAGVEVDNRIAEEQAGDMKFDRANVIDINAVFKGQVLVL